ncbi:MAG TPA: hypothetical protein VJV40_02845 [Thermodesulfobacteriota bacterium]|nr:hypothetical protein [Thermodesulfobacteriota bacterium]
MSISTPHSRYVSLLKALLILTIVTYIFTTEVRAGGSDKYPKCFIGTYLVEEGNGTRSLWSLGARGVIMITSSAQPALNFSDAQGAWIRTDKLRASATSLDFSFDGEGNLLNIAKVNADIRFTDKNCADIEGEFTCTSMNRVSIRSTPIPCPKTQ